MTLSDLIKTIAGDTVYTIEQRDDDFTLFLTSGIRLRFTAPVKLEVQRPTEWEEVH